MIAVQIMSIVAHEAHRMLEGINVYTGEVLEHVPAGSSHFETLLSWYERCHSSWLKRMESG